MGLARKVVRNSADISADDIESVRQYGFGDAEIFDIVAAAAARCFIAKIPDSLGTQADSVYLDIPERLRNALLVGRQIQEAAE